MARNLFFNSLLFPYLFIVQILCLFNAIANNVSGQAVLYASPPPPDNACPNYPCLPPSIVTTNCPPPPPAPPSPSPPPPTPVFNPPPTPAYLPFFPPPDYVNILYAPPPPDPILPYFPFYYKNPPPPLDFSSKAVCISNHHPTMTWITAITTVLLFLSLHST